MAKRGRPKTVKVAVKVPAREAKPSTALAIPTIAKGALSKDLGPMIIAGLAKTQRDETQAKQIIAGVQTKSQALLSQLTMGIVKLALADKTVNLAAIFGDDKAAKVLLGNQIGLALGYRQVYTVGEGAKAKQTIAYADSVKQYFPNADDKDKESPEAIAKATFRTNWAHRVTQCAQVANGIIEKKMKAEIDKGSGVLRLSGPAVAKQFGAKSVLLNEKQNVGEGKATVKLTNKPSFTAIATAAGEAHGRVRMTTSTARAAVTVDPDKAVQGMAAAFVAACEKLDGNKLVGVTRTALESVQNAIEKVLG